MRLEQLASVVRSKNAGPFMITVDVFFNDRAGYELARASGVLEPERVARAYGVEPSEIKGPYWHDEALGAKVTVPKRPSVNDLGCTDLFGAHQHLPVAYAEIDVARAPSAATARG